MVKIMGKIYSNKLLSLQLSLFVLLQPFIDIYRVFIGNKYEICSISVVEIINIILIGYLAILFLLNQRKLKTFLPALIYAIILLIYLILHCYNVLQFHTNIIKGTQINLLTEIYVVCRAYILPLMFLYMLIFIHTKRNCFLKTVLAVSWFISVIIIITNFFKVSFVSYASGLEKNRFIQQNIFEWFTQDRISDVRLLTSKGWFYSGNQIGLVLFMLFPISIYNALDKRKIYSYLLVVFQTVAMIMVSTKTAALGSLLVLLIMMALFAIFSQINKCWKTGWKPLLILLAIVIFAMSIIQFSPVKRMATSSQTNLNQINENNNIIENTQSDNENQQFNASEKERIAEILNKSYKSYGIPKEYIDLFPIKDNFNFWYSAIKNCHQSQINFRDFKQLMYTEVLRKNNNQKDIWLGIGYSTNFPYIERDVVSQIAWFGIFGMFLLVGPYLLLAFICLILIFKKPKECLNLYNCTLLISTFGGIFVSLLAGHLFGFIFPVSILTYLLIQLYQNIKNQSYSASIQ